MLVSSIVSALLLFHFISAYSSFLVKNHGIPEDIINSGLRAAEDFFQLPESAKKEVRHFYGSIIRL